MSPSKLKVGDTVEYTLVYLASLGKRAKGMGALRGKVVGLGVNGNAVIATVRWDGIDSIIKVNAEYLQRV